MINFEFYSLDFCIEKISSLPLYLSLYEFYKCMPIEGDGIHKSQVPLPKKEGATSWRYK